ncbi:hypothetical protein [Elizabethkingia anophelis]|uniref:hypothetical protein n=1 Tax=Elizabethkingia anophelis TaxID=1117645 RepID=UPI0023E972AF|nr:hypothetical protein [Elizabethkingia anophelis]GJN60428.1 hypothetical protein ELAK_05780 [Elizabethkingia anophelis]HDP3254043.1 hypothetical protein [Elizabethkingia anophelis]
MENLEVKIHEAIMPGLWYVYIYDVKLQKTVKKFYKGINKTNDPEERLKRAQYLQKEVALQLKVGVTFKSKKNSLPTPYRQDISVVEAYSRAYILLQESDLEPKTKETYKTHYGYFMEVVRNLKWDYFMFTDLDMYHFTIIIDNMVKLRDNGNAYFNKHIAICKAYCKILKDNFIIKENKAHGIPERKHKVKEKRLLTKEEQTIVINHFNQLLPNYNVYLKTLYHLSIRPKELRLLQCKMIKKFYKEKTSEEIWYFDLPEDITKNDQNDIVLIPEDLKKDLLVFNLNNPEWYIFGKDFSPNEIKQSVNRANKLWKSEVKDKLGIYSDMYYLKSKSSNDKLRNGMTKEAVKIINRHSSDEITEIYATQHEIITMENNLDKFGTFE